MRLQDKVAIITGAGQGIGLAYTERFLDEGARVVMAELHEERGEIGANSVRDRGEVLLVQTDIADPDSVQACVDATLDRFGRVDILVNNAAIYMDLQLGNNSFEYLKQIFDVNVHGQWLMARAVADHMVAQRYGRIVNQASIAAYLTTLGGMAAGEWQGLSNNAYGWSKWSVIGLTKFLAGQLGPYDVTVNCIAPGLTYTEATKQVVPDQVKQMFSAMQPVKREIQPEDMTGPAVFFASDDAAMVTGQVLCVDGGMVMPA
ncbi:MAG: SDR family oxidoreductase [Acidimicrobiales bacterium]|nr:SDR family oxidoreductase [Acidimicrobiales bacterium]